MARLLLGAAFGIMVGVVGSAAIGLHADELDAEVSAAAAAAHVDPTDLLGAVYETDTDPWTYLRGVGELPAPPLAEIAPSLPSPPPLAKPTASVPVVATTAWSALAQCESGGNPRANTGNGYYGLVQFDLPTWRAYGGTAYAARPDLASTGQQLAVAEKLRASRGRAPWPVCGRLLR
jgi:hypothetical protein